MAETATNESVYGFKYFIRGYYMCKKWYVPHEGDMLQYDLQEDNTYDAHAIAVQQDGTVVDHVPREVSRVFYITRRGM